VATVQGTLAGVVMAIGCLAGGYLCDRIRPRTAYALFGVLLASVAAAMALGGRSVPAYVAFSMVYNFGVGLAYAAFTATVLEAMGPGSAATKYNLYASLSNFPIWWLGLLLAWTADPGQRAAEIPYAGPALAGWIDPWLPHTASAMLCVEAGIGVLAVGVFLVVARTAEKRAWPG
jgi:MFS family permease